MRRKARPAPVRSLAVRRAFTFSVALAGTGAAWLAGLPLPFLFGPLFACLVAALAGAPIAGTGGLGKLMRTILGVAIGASITPEVVERIPQMAASLLLVPVFLVVTALIGVPYFRRVCGYDAPTSWYASMPGGLHEMALFGQEAGANVRALALIHATRLMTVVLVAPLLLTQLFEARLDNPIGAPAMTIPPSELAIMVAAGILGWKGAERLGLFGAAIIGPMIAAAALSLAGVLHYRPPAEAILAAQFFIGIGLSAGFVGVTFREIRRDVAAGAVFVLIVSALAAIMAEVIILLRLAPPIDGLLAFAPAGQAEMAVLAIVAGADLGYVVLHHLTRVFLIISFSPVAARLAGLAAPRKARERE